MHKYSRRQRHDSLLTATAAAEPVLIRLSNDVAHTMLLADDVTYDKAGVILLHRVRWVRAARNVRALLKRVPANGFLEELRLQNNESYVAAALPRQACVRVEVNSAQYSWVQLEKAQFIRLRAASPHRFLTTAHLLAGPLPAGKVNTRRGGATRKAMIQAKRLILGAPRKLKVAIVGA